MFTTNTTFMKSGIIFFLLLLSFFGQAQNKQQISLHLNRSFHGTGDMEGVGFAAEYGRYLTNHLELTSGIASNVHHKASPVILTRFNPPIDASFRMVTAGLQWQSNLSFVPLHTRKHEAKLGAGPIVRYQSSSHPDVYARTTFTNYPEPVFTFRHNEKQNVVTAGYQVALSYAFTFTNRWLLGIAASFQNDTNSDVISQYGIRLGKRF